MTAEIQDNRDSRQGQCQRWRRMSVPEEMRYNSDSDDVDTVRQKRRW